MRSLTWRSRCAGLNPELGTWNSELRTRLHPSLHRSRKSAYGPSTLAPARLASCELSCRRESAPAPPMPQTGGRPRKTAEAFGKTAEAFWKKAKALGKKPEALAKKAKAFGKKAEAFLEKAEAFPQKAGLFWKKACLFSSRSEAKPAENDLFGQKRPFYVKVISPPEVYPTSFPLRPACGRSCPPAIRPR